MTLREGLTLGASLALIGAMILAGAIVDRTKPPWLAKLRQSAPRRSRLQQTLLWAVSGAAAQILGLVIALIAGDLVHPQLYLIYVPGSALFVGLLSLLWTRNPEDEPHDWLVTASKTAAGNVGSHQRGND